MDNIYELIAKLLGLDYSRGEDFILSSAYTALNEQQAEIERLTTDLDYWKKLSHDEYWKQVKAKDAEIEQQQAEIERLRGNIAADAAYMDKLQAVVDAAKEFKEWWHEDMRGSVSYDKLCAALAALKEADDD